MKHAVTTLPTTLPAIATLLGQESMRIPTSGRIRAGIKVLTKKAADHPTAKELYDRGVAESRSFDDIEREITQTCPNLKTPLVPKNVAWFTVRPNDFPNPDTAGQIMDAFGEDRGDGIRRLYRFPVVFPADAWQAVLPHQLVMWGANGKKFWSEYGTDGIRYCKRHAPAPAAQTGMQVARTFGAPKAALRTDNGGICDPGTCPEFQTRQCNLSGRFIFFIPGIPSINAFELQTNSLYAMRRAIEQFRTVATLRGGRLYGFLDDKETPFYLAKKRRDVAHLDAQGRRVRSAQWIIELEAPIDIAALLQANGGGVALSDAHDSSDLNCAATVESMSSGMPNVGACLAPRTSPVSDSAALPVSAEQVLAAVAVLGIDTVRFERYAVRRWGPGWKLNANGRRRVFDEIERYRNDPDGFIDKIDAYLHLADKFA